MYAGIMACTGPASSFLGDVSRNTGIFSGAHEPAVREGRGTEHIALCSTNQLQRHIVTTDTLCSAVRTSVHILLH